MATFRLRSAHVAGLRRVRFAAGLQERLQAEGKITSYDPARSVVQGTDAAGRTFAYRLGEDGFIDAVKSPAGRVSYLRSDADGNLLEFVEPSGLASQFAYDTQGVPTGFGRNGQPLCRFEIDPERTRNDVTFWDGSRARATFDSGNRPLSLTNRLGATERFKYDSRGRLRAFVDANGAETRFFYGANAKLARTLHPDGSSDFATYDASGNVQTLRASGQRSTRIASTPGGRPTEIAYPDGVSSTFAYDGRGRLAAAEHASAASSYRYGDGGELLQETNGAHSFKFEYDPTGLLLSIEYPDQSRVAFEYDLDKRLARITDWSGAGSSFRRALDDRAESTSLPNGLETATTLTPAGQPERTLTRNARSGAVLYEAQAVFDVQGRLVSLADSELGKRVYSYDAESQLLAVHTGTGQALEWYSYDAAGNRSSINGNRVELGPGNRLLSAWNARCTYDRQGNLTRAEWYGKAWRYQYDARGQLVEAEGPNGKVRFSYDAFGRRLLKQSDTSKTEYVWCGEQLTREIITKGDTQQIRDYLYLPGTHTPFALRVDGSIYYYHCDHRGAPQRLTDTQGRVVWAAEYSAFGKALVHVALIENPLRFPGQYYDEETDLSYNRFRYYSAELGRYITPDPIGLLGGSNPYRYVGNDPINKTDPLGLWWKAALSVVAGVAVAAAIVLTAPVSLPLIAGAAVLGVAVGVGVDKALNIDHFCVSCFASAFASGFVTGAEIAVGFVAAAALFPEAAAALAVGGAVVGCYGILAEHLGWPMPAGELLSPSTWHLHSGKSFDEMNDAEKSASLGNLAGGTAGAVAGGALAEGVIEEPGVPPEEEGPIGEDPVGDEEPPIEPEDEEPPIEPEDEEPPPRDDDEEPPPRDDDEEPPPRDEDDEGRPDDEEESKPDDEDEDEAPPKKKNKLTKEQAEAECREKTRQHLDDTNERVENGELTKKEAGPVVAGVVDAQTGEFFPGLNDPNGQPPSDLHPLLQDRLDNIDPEQGHGSSPGSHAEVNALNDALNAREAAGNPVTEDDLADFTQQSLWRQGNSANPNGMHAGQDAPRCGNCTQLTRGVNNLSGDAPPKPGK